MRRGVACVSFAAMLAGCGVSRDLYLQKESELEACRTNLASGESDLKQCREQADLRQQELETREKHQAQAGAGPEECRKGEAAETATCRETAAKVEAELETTRREVEELRAKEAELRTRLQKEIGDQTVEIERLRAQLSVRVVDQILFDLGREEIRKEGKALLDQVAGVVAGSQGQVRVEGHADGTPVSKRLKGRFYSNWELSAARAANVVRYFQYAKGIDPARMEAVGVAQYRPAVPDDTFEGRAQNRRVVIILTPVAR